MAQGTGMRAPINGRALLRRSMLRAAAGIAVFAGPLAMTACVTPEAEGPQPGPWFNLATLEKVAAVDERFQSYNVEMVEVTGGRFWAPYANRGGERYRMRPPMDLSSERLRNLARHLGPSYVRVSGTWANSTYVQAEGEVIETPPSGFEQVLTRDQWRGLVDFSNAVDAKIVTSFAISGGARDETGVWQPEQAQRLLELTREAGGKIAAAEYANEPNATALGRFPAGYSAADYGRDFAIFRDWARASAPDLTILGPGSVGEGAIFGSIPVAAQAAFVSTSDMLSVNPGSVDAFSYHFYGAVSERCAGMGVDVASFDDALSPAWLDRTLADYRFYSALRDEYEPGKPIWLTETAQAACGGSPWAASFADSFRYLNQQGQLAQRGVQVVMHNTLAASDYALIDEETLQPRPNYWAALLWRRTMGSTVLSSPSTPSSEVRMFAHCLPKKSGGVGLAILNLGDEAHSIAFGSDAEVYSLTASDLASQDVLINQSEPKMTDSGAFTGLFPLIQNGAEVAPNSITFVAVKDAGNPQCKA